MLDQPTALLTEDAYKTDFDRWLYSLLTVEMGLYTCTGLHITSSLRNDSVDVFARVCVCMCHSCITQKS